MRTAAMVSEIAHAVRLCECDYVMSVFSLPAALGGRVSFMFPGHPVLEENTFTAIALSEWPICRFALGVLQEAGD